MITATLLGLQIAAFFLNIAIGVLGTCIPYWALKRGRNSPEKASAVLSYLNCASGGVLAGVSLVHVLPETGSVLNGKLSGFPLSYYITFAGVFLMVSMAKLGGHDEDAGHHTPARADFVINEGKLFGSSDQIQTVQVYDNGQEPQIKVVQRPAQKKPKGPAKSRQAVVMLLMGLLIHDISEGVSLGLMTTTKDFLVLFLAIFFHKSCEQICQAICGIKEGLGLRENLAYLIPLCLSTPVAQLVSFAAVYLTSGSEAQLPGGVLVAQDVLLSFAAGTFLGICFEEVVDEEIRPGAGRRQVAKKLLVFLAGSCFIALVAASEFLATRK